MANRLDERNEAGTGPGTEPGTDAGSLLYVMGSSGAGKDSLIGYARRTLGEDAGVVFAHRYITRPAHADGENHVALSAAEFEMRSRNGLFLFDWRSHGFRYGIGVEVAEWLRRGLHVVVNGSRAYLPRARQRVPSLLPVLVCATPERLRERLLGRGREAGAEVQQRLARGEEYADVRTPGLRVIKIEAKLVDGGVRVVELLRSVRDPMPGHRLDRGR